MEETNNSFLVKVGNIVKKYAWVLAIVAAVLAIAFLFLPILKYEIREALYDIESNERVYKEEHVYGANIIWILSIGHHLGYTLYITIALIVVGIGFVCFSKLNKDLLTVAGIFFLLAVCMFILSKEFFKGDVEAIEKHAKIVGIDHDETKQYFYSSLHDVEFSWGATLGVAFCTIAFAFTTLSNQSSSTKQIAEEGVLLALAFVLNLVKIPVGATGGSINFQMLPLMIIALRHGPAHGFIAGGIVYGLLTCLTDGYGFACYPFDYLIGFGSVAVMGVFRKQIFGEDQEGYNIKGLIFIFLGGLLSTLVRYIGSNVSSIVVYGYTLQAALAYNAFYIPLSGLIATVAFMGLYAPLIRINKLYPVKSI